MSKSFIKSFKELLATYHEILAVCKTYTPDEVEVPLTSLVPTNRERFILIIISFKSIEKEKKETKMQFENLPFLWLHVRCCTDFFLETK